MWYVCGRVYMCVYIYIYIYIYTHIKGLVGNPAGLRTLGRHTSKLEDNTKKYTQEI